MQVRIRTGTGSEADEREREAVTLDRLLDFYMRCGAVGKMVLGENAADAAGGCCRRASVQQHNSA